MPEVAPFTFEGLYDGFPVVFLPTHQARNKMYPFTDDTDVSDYDYWTTFSGVNKENVGSLSPEQLQAKIAESHELACAWFWNLYKVNVDVYMGPNGVMSEVNTREHVYDQEYNVIPYDPLDRRIAIMDEEDYPGTVYIMENIVNDPLGTDTAFVEVLAGPNFYTNSPVERYYNDGVFVGYGFPSWGGIEGRTADAYMNVLVRGYSYELDDYYNETAYCEIPITNSEIGPIHAVCCSRLHRRICRIRHSLLGPIVKSNWPTPGSGRPESLMWESLAGNCMCRPSLCWACLMKLSRLGKSSG